VDVVFIRFSLCPYCRCYLLSHSPLQPARNYAAAVGLLIGAGIVVFEWRLREMSLKRLIGSAIGSVLGIIGAYLFASSFANSIPPSATQSFLQIMVMLIMAYVGLAVAPTKATCSIWPRSAASSRRKVRQKGLQDPRHQRHYRRPHRRHRRDRFPRRSHCDPAVRAP